MTAAFETRDGRLVARIIALAHRFGCGYTRVDVRMRDGDVYDAQIDFTGAQEQLRRLEAQITKLLDDEEMS